MRNQLVSETLCRHFLFYFTTKHDPLRYTSKRLLFLFMSYFQFLPLLDGGFSGPYFALCWGQEDSYDSCLSHYRDTLPVREMLLNRPRGL